ncbi:MAG: arsenate reductase family protein [Clostridia bacterium]
MKNRTQDYLLIWYPKCSTCQKAKRWLEQKEILFQERHIVEENPTEEELKKWIKVSQKEIKKWFNTSGLKYKQLNLKEKLDSMKEEEKIKLLASDGMLIKRPILINEKFVLNGFKEAEWEKYLTK